jgi:hypothetical protein
MSSEPLILILTPVKDATPFLDQYVRNICALSYPAERISLGFLEGDSRDDTYTDLESRLQALRAHFHSVGLWQRSFGFRLPPGLPRWTEALQLPRRTALAKARNHLLSRALVDEDWVLWIDVDVVEYPHDIIERLLATGKDIVHPHCVCEYGGASFDLNAWADRGHRHMDDLRNRGELVRLDSVGGTMLLVRADAHRDGLVFPPFPYGNESPLVRARNPILGRGRGEIETEGLALMARDMGLQCWGLPHLEILHWDGRTPTEAVRAPVGKAGERLSAEDGDR